APRPRSLLRGPAVLHESRRHGPVATPRLDRPPAQQDPAVVLGHAADHQPRGLVVNYPAGVAAGTRERSGAPHWLQNFMMRRRGYGPRTGLSTLRKKRNARRGAELAHCAPGHRGTYVMSFQVKALKLAQFAHLIG